MPVGGVGVVLGRHSDQGRGGSGEEEGRGGGLNMAVAAKMIEKLGNPCALGTYATPLRPTIDVARQFTQPPLLKLLTTSPLWLHSLPLVLLCGCLILKPLRSSRAVVNKIPSVRHARAGGQSPGRRTSFLLSSAVALASFSFSRAPLLPDGQGL